jgi:colanic acid biosynthesis protein WcaH
MIIKENKMFLKKDIFKCIVEFAPLISIDFLIKKDNKFLLGRRINSPAKGYYFTIGGRIFKNETIKEAKKRILKEELNINKKIDDKFLGIFEHFYEDSFFEENISTHYVNLAYLVEFDSITDNLPLKQHSEYIWLNKDKILNRNDVHKYVKDYFKGSKYV